jgi:hypothetical protein
MIEASQAYRNDGAIILWWDETEGGDDPSRTLGEIIISPDARGNAYTNNIRYTHASDLLTMQESTARASATPATPRTCPTFSRWDQSRQAYRSPRLSVR